MVDLSKLLEDDASERWYRFPYLVTSRTLPLWVELVSHSHHLVSNDETAGMTP